jgi:hypothetical protein
MKRLLALVALLFSFGLAAAHAEKKHTVIFEATVVRIDTWGLMKFFCGAAVNYRLAEYNVDAVLSGHLAPGKRIVAKQLACNWNELDDLKPGDKVVVTAEILKQPEKSSWQPDLDERATDLTKNAKSDETTSIPASFKPVLVQCDVKRVSKVIYPPSH